MHRCWLVVVLAVLGGCSPKSPGPPASASPSPAAAAASESGSGLRLLESTDKRKRKSYHRKLGDTAYRLGHYPAAVKEYRKVLAMDASDPNSIIKIGLAHHQLGELDLAWDYLVQGKALSPDNHEVRLALGTIEHTRGRDEAARTEAVSVVDRYPSYLDALSLLVDSSATPEEAADAIARLERVRDSLEGGARFHLLLGQAHTTRRDFGAAEKAYQAALKVDPDSIEARVALGKIQMAKRDLTAAEREFKGAAELAPAGSKARVRLAAFYLMAGRPEAAARVLAEMTQRAPEYLPAFRMLAALACDHGLYEPAAKAAAIILEREPGDPVALLVRGRCEFARGDFDAAVTAFRALVAAEPESAGARFEMARAQLRAGKLAAARAQLVAALGKSPDFEPAVLLLATVDLGLGQAGPAVERLRQYVGRQQDSLEAHCLLSQAECDAGDREAALATAKRIAALAPGDPRGPYLAGRALLALGRKDEARESFEASLDLAPGFIGSIEALVELDRAGGGIDQAVTRLETQIERAPSSAPLLYLLGRVEASRRHDADAEAAYRRAVEADPRLVGPHVELGRMYASAGRYREAGEHLDLAVQGETRNVDLFLLAGAVHEKAGDLWGAEAAYKRVLAIDPQHAAAANNLAYLIAEHGGDLAQAIRLARVAREKAPAEPRYADTLGWLLHAEGKAAEALENLRMAAAGLPDNPAVQCHLGMALSRSADPAQAKEVLARAIGLKADFPGVEDCRKALAELR
jgi:tetratricopeptide (TPR) repeat protein